MSQTPHPWKTDISDKLFCMSSYKISNCKYSLKLLCLILIQHKGINLYVINKCI